MKEIACFVSPHGYGHASRCIAVIEALQELEPDLRIHIITTVTPALFDESLSHYTYHECVVDIGLAQDSALQANIGETIKRLTELLPYSKTLLAKMMDICKDCSLILCDIAPLGIATATQLQIPSVLVENFTWDWIYQPYLSDYPKLGAYADYLSRLFAEATHRIQTEPLCRNTACDILCGPIARRLKGTDRLIRVMLAAENKKIVVVTMGGVSQKSPRLNITSDNNDILYVLTGQDESKKINENLFLLARDGVVYHPDLIAAADLVVCKAGYSTIAECAQAGARVLGVGRSDFAETVTLNHYLKKELLARCIDSATYTSGRWFDIIPELLEKKRPKKLTSRPSMQIAEYIHKFL